MSEVAPRSARFGGKTVALLSFLTGFCCTVIWTRGGSAQELAVQESAITLAQLTQPARGMQPAVSPQLAKLVITAIQATNSGKRDVSMKAQVMDEFSKLDGATKTKLLNVRAEAELKAEEMAGVTAPLGFWDPLGFSTECSAGRLLFYREAELKHGRIGMLATLGFLIGEKWHPLFGGELAVPALDAFKQTSMGTFWAAAAFLVVIPEIASALSFEGARSGPLGDTPYENGPYSFEDKDFLLEPTNTGGNEAMFGGKRKGTDAIFTGKSDKFYTMPTDRVPGDLGFDPLGMKPKDPEEFKKLQTKEINNGRLAMLAAVGIMAQEMVTGKWVF